MLLVTIEVARGGRAVVEERRWQVSPISTRH